MAHRRHCLKRWQSCLSKQLELLTEVSNEARNSEVPRAATTQPHEPPRHSKSLENAENGVGEKGETPRGRVDEGAAAALGPGTATTEHQTTDGGSLTTPASGPDDREMVKSFVKPLPTPLPVVPTMPPLLVWTPPRAYETNGKGHSEVNEDDEDRRAHTKRIDKQTSRVYTTATTPHPPQSLPLEGERTGQTSGGGIRLTARKTDWSTKTSASAQSASRNHPDAAKATTDPGDATTSASVRSASRTYPLDGDAESTDAPRPSEDPGGATGDDERRPDAPTEPPDQPAGTRGRGGEGVGDVERYHGGRGQRRR